MGRHGTRLERAAVAAAPRALPAVALFALSSVPARALPPQDPNNIVTIQAENDAVTTLSGTSDQYYTSGLRVAWTSATDDYGVARPIQDLGHTIWGDGVQRVSIGLDQSIFTPRDTQISPPDPDDRPYAADLILTVRLLTDKDTSRSFVGVDVGVLGPYAQGEEVQNGFHGLIGDTGNRGWDYQLPNSPVFQLEAGRVWRLPLASLYGIDADALPQAYGEAGSLRDALLLGGQFRVGQGLTADYGVPRIEPGNNGLDAYVRVRPVSWYVFGGVDGQAVAFDETIDGSTFRDPSRHADRIWDVGEFAAGAAVIWRGVRLSYSQNWQTQEFRGARSGLFSFGSAALSFKF